MIDTSGTSSYEYDKLGRITKVTNGSEKVVTYTYDTCDNLASIGYPDGTSVYYEYDLNGKLTKVTDKNGKITEYHYDELNRLSETIRPNDTKTSYTYNILDQIVLIENKCSTCNENISSYSYRCISSYSDDFGSASFITYISATSYRRRSRSRSNWHWYRWSL